MVTNILITTNTPSVVNIRSHSYICTDSYIGISLVIDSNIFYCYTVYMLEPKEEKLLEETYKIEKENNEMLHSLYRNMWTGRLFRVFYWVIILGVMAGSFYYAQPYIEKLMTMYNQASNLFPSVKP